MDIVDCVSRVLDALDDENIQKPPCAKDRDQFDAYWQRLGARVWSITNKLFDKTAKATRWEIVEQTMADLFGERAMSKEQFFYFIILPEVRAKRNRLLALSKKKTPDPGIDQQLDVVDQDGVELAQ